MSNSLRGGYAAPIAVLLELVILDLFVVRIDDAVVIAACLRASLAGIRVGVRLTLRGRVLVKLLGHGVERLLDFLGCSLDGGEVGALLGGLQLLDGFLDGVVLRSISLVNTPPIVSMPRDSGVTSSSSRPLTSPPSTPP